MSSLFGSSTIKGTRLTDFSGTSAEVGRGIAFGYGAYPVDGVINWAPLPPVEHRQVKRQGKGGVKQETFTYTLSYGVLFCKGPIYGFRWIKRNGKVVYTTDPNAPLEDKQYAAKWAQRVNFHYGTPDQLPDSLIESYEGAGNVSAFVNFCYITIEDEDVTDNGGAPPNYEAVAIADGVSYSTSRPYPVEVYDSLTSSADVGPSEWRALRKDAFMGDTSSLSARFGNVEYRRTRKDARAPIDTAVVGARLGTGTHRTVLKNAYTPTDTVGVGARIGTGMHKRIRFDTRMPQDRMKLGARIGTGTKT